MPISRNTLVYLHGVSLVVDTGERRHWILDRRQSPVAGESEWATAMPTASPANMSIASVTAILVEIDEDWATTDRVYINMLDQND
jgi:hypothetical protein